MPRKRALKPEVADGIREVGLGAYKTPGIEIEEHTWQQEPPYTEPYVRWCGRTEGVSPPPTR